jgi:hypothetical protein
MSAPFSLYLRIQKKVETLKKVGTPKVEILKKCKQSNLKNFQSSSKTKDSLTPSSAPTII